MRPRPSGATSERGTTDRLGLTPACTSLAALLASLVLPSAACAGPTCDEDIRAQTDLARIDLRLGDESVATEIADTTSAVQRGWKHRRCEREAIALLAPEPASQDFSVWGCGLVDPVALYFVRDAVVVHVHEALSPCADDCSGCTLVPSPTPVDGVIETLVGRTDLALGDTIAGWPLPLEN